MKRTAAESPPTNPPLRSANILRLASSCGARISLCGATSLRTCADPLRGEGRTGSAVEEAALRPGRLGHQAATLDMIRIRLGTGVLVPTAYWQCASCWRTM